MNDEDDCPICATIPAGKVFQCKEGHIICEPCLRQIQANADRARVRPTCPSCAGPLDNGAVSRNRVLEIKLDRLTIDCHHAATGCPTKLKRDKIKDHENSCVFGQNIAICSKFLHNACDFRLTVSNAKAFLQHIKSFHQSVKVHGNRISWTDWMHRKKWEGLQRKAERYCYILKVCGSQKYVMIMEMISGDTASFCSVDLSLGLSVADELWVNFLVTKESLPLMSWSFPVACGIDSWKYLEDNNSQTQIQIGIPSLLQYCDKEDELKMTVEVKCFTS